MTLNNIVFIAALVIVVGVTNGQVSVGDNLPDSTLDLQISSSASPQNMDGILIPRVDNLPSSNPTVTQDGMLIYLTEDDGNREKGFYYWINDYGQWVPFFREWDADPSNKWISNRQGVNKIYFKDQNRLMGIGSSSPQETLDVTGESQDNNIQITTTDQIDTPSLIYYTRLGNETTPSQLINDEPIGYMTGKVWKSGKSGDMINTRMEADGNHTTTSLPTHIKFSVTSVLSTKDDTRAMTIKNNGLIGFSTENPTATVDVNGNLAVENLQDGFVPVYSTSQGVLYDGPRIIAAGKLNGSASIIGGKEYNVNTSVRNSTGNYTITINSAKPNYIVNLATNNCSTCVIYYDYINNTTFNVYIYDITTGNPVNNQFMFSAIDFN